MKAILVESRSVLDFELPLQFKKMPRKIFHRFWVHASLSYCRTHSKLNSIRAPNHSTFCTNRLSVTRSHAWMLPRTERQNEKTKTFWIVRYPGSKSRKSDVTNEQIYPCLMKTTLLVSKQVVPLSSNRSIIPRLAIRSHQLLTTVTYHTFYSSWPLSSSKWCAPTHAGIVVCDKDLKNVLRT